LTQAPDGSAARRALSALYPFSLIYGRVAEWRRAWYAAHPEARRRLARPVISIGNLTVGGSGKTPAVAHLAQLLLEHGERPSILSRGYARRGATDDVVTVSDPSGLRASVEASGDEPQMLARALPGVPVLVCADRYRAGRQAEDVCGSTVHLLDDGFQHFALHRDIDLLLVAPGDLRGRVLPAGRLREPARVARGASAIIATGPGVQAPAGVPQFGAVLGMEPPRCVVPFGEAVMLSSGAPVLTLCGIARPERFVATVREAGWTVVAERAFRDHHWFTAAEVAAVVADATAAGARAIVTTAKDAVRLEGLPAVRAAVAASPLPFVFLPIALTITPQATFVPWLLAQVAQARVSGGSHAGDARGA